MVRPSYQETSDLPRPHRPLLIIHGGAGTISRSNVPPGTPVYNAYIDSIRSILTQTYPLLVGNKLSALDASVYAVSLLEDNPLFNAGKGSVFTREGTNELEASVMVSNPEASGGYKCTKRGVGVVCLKHVKNPIKLARELLLREDDVGARHCCISGEGAERLASKWGLEMVDQAYFWTEKRWTEHLRGLEKERELEQEKEKNKQGGERGKPLPSDYQSVEGYLPQGTVGCITMDSHGNIAVATSTGGLTNKISGRVGDTPTLGAGFWAESWELDQHQQPSPISRYIPTLSKISSTIPPVFHSLLSSCLPTFLSPDFPPPRFSSSSRYPYTRIATMLYPKSIERLLQPPLRTRKFRRLALSGTGNGEFFLRFGTCLNISSRCRFSAPNEAATLSRSSREVLQEMKEAETEDSKGNAGVIGIEAELEIEEGSKGNVARKVKSIKGNVVWELNCEGMYRGYIDEKGRARAAIFADEEPY